MLLPLPGLRSSLRLEGESIRSRASAASKVLSERWILAPWTEASTETKAMNIRFMIITQPTKSKYVRTHTEDNTFYIQHTDFLNAISLMLDEGPTCVLRGNPQHLLLVSINGEKREMLLQNGLTMFGYLAEATAQCRPEKLSLGRQLNQSISRIDGTQTNCGAPADHRAGM